MILAQKNINQKYLDWNMLVNFKKHKLAPNHKEPFSLTGKTCVVTVNQHKNSYMVERSSPSVIL